MINIFVMISSSPKGGDWCSGGREGKGSCRPKKNFPRCRCR